MFNLNVALLLLGLCSTAFLAEVAADNSDLSENRYPKILGASTAKRGEFKYVVSLQDGINKAPMCGGSIISNRHILTAAHCVMDENFRFRQIAWTIVAATTDAKSPDSSAVKVDVDRIYVSRDYKQMPKAPNGKQQAKIGDIAVLRLKQPLGLSTNSNLAKLELFANDISTSETEQPIIAAYGHDNVKYVPDPKNPGKKIEKTWSSGKLNYAPTELVYFLDCFLKYTSILSENHHICARVQQTSSTVTEGMCAGDSGSPLVLYGDTVIGVASSSPKGCNEGYLPGVYTKVSTYLPFIEHAMKDNISHRDMRVANVILKKSLFSTSVEVRETGAAVDV